MDTDSLSPVIMVEYRDRAEPRRLNIVCPCIKDVYIGSSWCNCVCEYHIHTDYIKGIVYCGGLHER